MPVVPSVWKMHGDAVLSVSGWTHRSLYHLSLPLCSCVTPFLPLALCNTCSPVFHPMFMAMRLSVIVEDLPGLSPSCPWVFEPGWFGLAVANWRAEQTAWGESVWRSNWRHRWHRKKTWRAERKRKYTGTEQQCGTVQSDLRTTLISASWNTDIIQICGEHTFVKICSELSESRILRTDGRQQKRASLGRLVYALTLTMNVHPLLQFTEITTRRL